MALHQSSELVDQCFAVQCKQCGKTTWQGCGMHIDKVMSNVPEAERCSCPRK